MQSERTELAGRKFDILVIGAGMFGACIAWAAALRGYSVALVDKGDFGGATSSNHYKFIHGGIRYLQHLDLVRLRESSHEKSALIRIAPHLCYPLPIAFPTYGYGKRGKPLMRAAMLAYDILTMDRNRGIKDPARRTPMGTTIDREASEALFGGIPKDGLTGTAIFHDGQIYNPARLVLAFVRSAKSIGAAVANYVSAERLKREDDRVVGCEMKDELSGQRFDVDARLVVNAAGPWAHLLLRDQPNLELKPEPSFSRDLAFVVNKAVSAKYAIGCQVASTDSDAILDRGGRHLFLVPWRGKTLVGVWHRYSSAHPDRLAVSTEELHAYIDEINSAYSGLNLSIDDVGVVNTGHILFGAEAAQGSASEHSFAKRSVVFDHAQDGMQGLVTVVGARATVARGVAEKTLDLVQRKLGDRITRSNTESTRIHGGSFDDFSALVEEIASKLPDKAKDAAVAIAHNYGSKYDEVLDCATNPDLLHPIGHSNVIRAEALNAMQNEMATSLADIALRRTELGTGDNPGRQAVQELASVVEGSFGWSAEETTEQVQRVCDTLECRGPWNFVDSSAQLEVNEN